MYAAKPRRPHPFDEVAGRDIQVVPCAGFSRPIRIHVREAGPVDAPSLLLIHGLMTSSYSWRYVIEPLSRRFRVVVPDLPSAGRSEAATDFPYTLEAFGQCIGAISRAVFGEARPLVVANSLGGLHALRFALDEPQALRGLVVIHCPGHPELRFTLMHHGLRLPLVPRAFSRFTHLLGDRFVPMVQRYHDQSILSGEEIEEYGQLFDTPEGSACFTNILRGSLDVAACARLREDLRAEGPDLPWPLLFIWGEEDKLLPFSTAEIWRALAPRAKFVAVPGSGHFVQVEAPEAIVREVEAFADVC